MDGSARKRKLQTPSVEYRGEFQRERAFQGAKTPQTPSRPPKRSKMMDSSPITAMMMPHGMDHDERDDEDSWVMSSSPLRSSPLKTSPFQPNNGKLNTVHHHHHHTSSSPFSSLDHHHHINDSIEDDSMIKYINLSPFVSLPSTANSNFDKQWPTAVTATSSHRRLCVSINDDGFAIVGETTTRTNQFCTPLHHHNNYHNNYHNTPPIVDVSASALKYIDPFMTTIQYRTGEGYNDMRVPNFEDEQDEDEEDELWDGGNLHKINVSPLTALKRSIGIID